MQVNCRGFRGKVVLVKWEGWVYGSGRIEEVCGEK